MLQYVMIYVLQVPEILQSQSNEILTAIVNGMKKEEPRLKSIGCMMFLTRLVTIAERNVSAQILIFQRIAYYIQASGVFQIKTSENLVTAKTKLFFWSFLLIFRAFLSSKLN